ncbi:MAG: FHA domain-containing protein, partial [Bdellovibrionaceae bacterium]|nr:FHA domain-containing protein [Pseudobdellovibrionaceae bacterium]
MNRFKLELISETKQEWSIGEYAFVGRDSACAIFLNDERIEKKHALVEIRQDRLSIKDMKTPSGLQVNGVKVIEALLEDGDVVTIGAAELLVHDRHKVKVPFAHSSLSEHWNQQLQFLQSVAQTPFPVLLLGPSGTGKDVLAQSLHQAS